MFLEHWSFKSLKVLNMLDVVTWDWYYNLSTYPQSAGLNQIPISSTIKLKKNNFNNMLAYSENLRIQPEYGKIRITKNSVFRHFSRNDLVSKICQFDVVVYCKLFTCKLVRYIKKCIQGLKNVIVYGNL